LSDGYDRQSAVRQDLDLLLGHLSSVSGQLEELGTMWRRRCHARGLRPIAPTRGREASAGGYDILILDAATRQSLASVRSLGRAGLRVAAGESITACGPSRSALTFRSRYSARNVVLPAITEDGGEFAAAVVGFVREHRIRVVLPTGDNTIAALLPRREQLTALGCVLALGSSSAVEVANDKDRTLAAARVLGIDQPKTVRIDSAADVPARLAEFDFPAVLKPTRSWTGKTAERLGPVDVISEAEAVAVTEGFLAAGAGVLAQTWACGRREGITLLVAAGEVLASWAHAEHRTTPALGGASVVRESITIPPDSYAASVRLVLAIGLEGLCEVEFRRDADNRPLLMEINARLPTTIENAVLSGVNFPLMIWQWATGLEIDHVDGYRTGVRTRWLRGDIRWLVYNSRRAGRPDSVTRTRALWIFTTEFARTRHYDCLDWRDPGPAFTELRLIAAAARRLAT
jgi:predicted ATP-grasp superfamily ATP-dependent carboligase